MKKRATGSFACKVIAYVFLAVSVFVGLLAGGGTVYLAEENVYQYSRTGWVEESLVPHVQSDMNQLLYKMDQGMWDSVYHFCENSNLDVEIIRHFEEYDHTEWSDYTGYETPYTYSFIWEDKDVNYDGEYSIVAHVNTSFPVMDSYRQIYGWTTFLYDWRMAIPVVMVGGAILAFLCFLFLLCAAGHRNGTEGLVPSVLHPIPLDVLTGLFGAVALLAAVFFEEVIWQGLSSDLLSIAALLVLMSLEAVWITIYLAELATRMKLGKWWKNTLIYVVLSLIGKVLGGIGRGIVTILRGIPMTVDALILVLGISLVEFICLELWSEDRGVMLMWLISKLVLIPLVIYLVMICRKLQEGSKELAKGNLAYRVDTKGMVLGFREHADNLNMIRNGMGIALEERMHSEHLKTELVTNVSHDIKTPLTSIINYADLLGNMVMTTPPEEQPDREKLVEYTDVLLRQSKRMKKLLEDLVEVSKATTGNLEVAMAPCEIGVMLSQAVGEYEQRFEQQQLRLLISQPDTPVRILADGRHLWRIFDNLLNNICKYAQENSRVYVNVEARAGQVEITFRNMSKYVLNVSGKELEERFVRGDKSRHMEGSGLGLSIAKSLMDLQNGRMEIVTDGDLFKVILRFKQLPEDAQRPTAPMGQQPPALMGQQPPVPMG